MPKFENDRQRACKLIDAEREQWKHLAAPQVICYADQLLVAKLIASHRDLHRRAQSAESEIARIKRRDRGFKNEIEYWKKMWEYEGETRRKQRRRYTELWRVIHERIGRRAYAKDEDLREILRGLLRPGFIRSIAKKLW